MPNLPIIFRRFGLIFRCFTGTNRCPCRPENTRLPLSVNRQPIANLFSAISNCHGPNLSPFHHLFAGIYHLGHGCRGQQSPDNRQIGQPTTAPRARNLLPICYRHGGICYDRSKVHQVAPRNRQVIFNPFPVIVNLTALKSAVSSTTHRKSIDHLPESIDSPAQSTDNRPIFRRNRPILHPPSAFVAALCAHFSFQLSEFQLFPL
jgi:hypothetical protein